MTYTSYLATVRRLLYHLAGAVGILIVAALAA